MRPLWLRRLEHVHGGSCKGGGCDALWRTERAEAEDGQREEREAIEAVTILKGAAKVRARLWSGPWNWMASCKTTA